MGTNIRDRFVDDETETILLSEREVIDHVAQRQDLIKTLPAVQCEEGTAKGRRYIIDTGTHRIGRSATCEIWIEDDLASREHAHIIYKEGKLLLRDNHSTNGTLLNGRKVATSELADQDLIEIGSTVLIVEIPKK